MRITNPWVMIATIVLGSSLVRPAWAGDISVRWDAVAGATGYNVYYDDQARGQSGHYAHTFQVTTNSATIQGLQNCHQYYVAVKAFNSNGESRDYSSELSGWARPSVTSATPASARQGDQIVMDITGNNFQNGAFVDLGNPNVVLNSVTVVSCSHIQLLATVEPTAGAVRPAEVGSFDVIVSNPDLVFGAKSQGFEVLVNPARFDINKSDDTTRNRIDGKDTVYLSRDFGVNESNATYAPDDDFNGDGWVDGDDLAYIASNLGRCWSASTKSWTFSACPGQ